MGALQKSGALEPCAGPMPNAFCRYHMQGRMRAVPIPRCGWGIVDFERKESHYRILPSLPDECSVTEALCLSFYTYQCGRISFLELLEGLEITLQIQVQDKAELAYETSP